MLCKEAKHFFADLADHSLSGEHEAKHHVTTCRPCSLEFQHYQRLIARLGALPRPTPSHDLRRSIYIRLDERDEHRVRKLGWRILLPATALATAAIAGWVAINDFNGESQLPTEMASIQKQPPARVIASPQGGVQEDLYFLPEFMDSGAVSTPAAAIRVHRFGDAYPDTPWDIATHDLRLRPVWGALDATDPVRAAFEFNSLRHSLEKTNGQPIPVGFPRIEQEGTGGIQIEANPRLPAY